jgi:hypothetical protein
MIDLRTRLFGVGALLTAWSGALAGQPSEQPNFTARLPECAFAERPTLVFAMRDAPMIAHEFQRQRVAIADAGEAFNWTDVVGPPAVPERQFARAYGFGERWIVWYWRGGFGVTLHIREMVEFTPVPGGPMALRMTPNALGGEPCQATQAILDGVRSAQGY